MAAETIRIEYTSLSELKRHPRNPKDHDNGAIAKSIERFGYIAPILMDERTGYVVAGHGRIDTLVALKEQGKSAPARIDVRRKEWYVPVVRGISFNSDHEVEAYLVADNRLTTLGGWNEPDLAGLLQELVNEDHALFEATGFDDADLQALLDELTPPMPASDPGAQVDRAAELQQKWQTERGQLWQIGKHKLLCGDSTNADDVARLMAGELGALAWFDPPFGIDLQPQRGLTDAIANDGNLDARQLWAKFLPLLYSNLCPDAHVFLCQDWTEFDWTLPLVRQHFTLKSKVVWFKNVWGIGYYTRPQHEDVIYCWKGKPPTIDEPVSDVWEVARSSAPIHAAEKPSELSAQAIRAFSHTDDIVLDWFAGVGGSMTACEQLGRRSRSLELEPKYCAVILERMAGMGLTPELQA